MNSKNAKIALVAIAIVLAGVVIYFAFGKQPEAITQTTPVNETANANWETYKNEEYGFSFKYPKTYSMTKNDHSEALLSINIEYPTGGQYRGMNISISNKTLLEVTKSIEQNGYYEHGYKDENNKIIADLSWRAYSYNPENDESATDQSKSVVYYLEKDGKLFTISPNIGVGLENITVEQADKNIETILSTFQFTK